MDICNLEFRLRSLNFIGHCMKLRMFLIYTKPSTMRMGEAGFEQLANVVRFRIADTFFPRKKCIFLSRGDVVQNVTYGEK